MSKISFQSIIRWLCTGTLAVMPLVVVPFVLYPFVFGKTLFFELMMFIIIAFFVSFLITTVDARQKTKEVLLNPLTLILALVLFSQWLSSLIGVDFDRSFWGDEERGMGLFVLTFAFLWFLMMRVTVATRNDASHVLYAIAFSGIATSLVALSRYFGVTIFGVDTGFRISGTIANPIFFAGILVFFAGVSALLAVRALSRFTKIFWWAITLGQLIVIVLTKTRGTLLGMVVVLFFIISFIAIKQRGRIRYLAYATIAIGVGAALLIFLFRENLRYSKIYVIQRIASTSLSDQTFRTRFGAWESGLNAFVQRPLFGWGQENFAVAFDAHYNPELMRSGFSETRFDRAHNLIIQTLVDGGLVGMFFLIVLYGVLLVWCHKKSKLTHYEKIIVYGIIVANFIHLLLAFDTTISILLLYLMVVVMSSDDDLTQKNYRINGKAWTVVAMGLVLVAPCVYILVIQPLQQNNALLNAVVYASDYNKVKAVPQFELALGMPTLYSEEARVEYVKNITRILDEHKTAPEVLVPLMKRADELAHINMNAHPFESYYPFLLGIMYRTGGYVDPSYLSRAEELFDRALLLSPHRQMYYFAKADIYNVQKKYDLSLIEYEKALAAAPNVPQSLWYKTVTLAALGRVKEADPLIVSLAQLHFMPPSKEELQLFATTLDRLGRYDLSVRYYKDVVENDIKNAAAWAQFATVSHKVKNYGDARFAALYAVRIDPTFADEAAAFIKQLPHEGKGYPLTPDFMERTAASIHYVVE